jgi:arylsulfatase A-like enzyme
MRFTHLHLVALFLATALAALSAERPNILLIMTDDQGWGDITSHGNDKIETPVMDSIAAAGARFDRFYVSPVCAPTRASLLTGRYHLRTGVSGVTRGWETMRASELTIAEALRSGGYRTGAFGKWHNGRHYPNHPNGQGFDEFYGFLGGHWNQYFDTHLERNGKRVQTSGYITDVLTDAALGFIRESGDQPWFCYVPYNAPHSPWEVPDKYWNKYANRGLNLKARCAYAMVDCLDENIGRLLTALHDLGLEGNTIVIFLTDNGPNSDRFNGDMRGRKGSVHEGGIRVPLYVRWPGHIEPGMVIEPIAAHFDLLPTILDMVEVAKPNGPPIDGHSLWPLLQGESVSWPDRMIFTGRVRNGDLSAPVGSVRTQRWRAVREKGTWALFDMAADPGQKRNVGGKHPEVLAKLSGSYGDWLEDATGQGLDYIPIPIGHPDRQVNELPANEAFLKPAGHGNGIGYIHSGGTANAWLVDWTSTDAYPQWEVEVLTAGEYEVTLLYNCRAADVGAKLQVQLGGESIEGQIDRAFYADFEPNNDRVPKVDDHYEEKDWAPLDLGVVTLPQGRTTLAVRVLSKPGREVMELRAVRLTRR